MATESGQTDFLSNLLASYLMSERQHYFPLAQPIPELAQEALKSFFRPELLQFTRIHELGGRSLRNPDFYSTVKRIGISNLPDFTLLDAITYEDVIVLARSMTLPTLFHELVHVEQFRQLGITGFTRRYVTGFLASGAYEAIPLELQAYGLGAQYQSDPRRPFSVEEEVTRWIVEGRF